MTDKVMIDNYDAEYEFRHNHAWINRRTEAAMRRVIGMLNSGGDVMGALADYNDWAETYSKITKWGVMNEEEEPVTLDEHGRTVLK